MNNLAKYRGKHGLTQTQLSEQLGVTKAALSFFENNTLSPKTAQKCAEILGENAFALLGLDALKLVPKTEEDKNILIELIKGL